MAHGSGSYESPNMDFGKGLPQATSHLAEKIEGEEDVFLENQLLTGNITLHHFTTTHLFGGIKFSEAAHLLLRLRCSSLPRVVRCDPQTLNTVALEPHVPHGIC